MARGKLAPCRQRATPTWHRLRFDQRRTDPVESGKAAVVEGDAEHGLAADAKLCRLAGESGEGVGLGFCLDTVAGEVVDQPVGAGIVAEGASAVVAHRFELADEAFGLRSGVGEGEGGHRCLHEAG